MSSPSLTLRQLETYYGLSYTIVSLIFLTPFAGYSVAAVVNARVHMALGQRGVAVLAPVCHIVTYAVLAAHPPYPVLVACNALSGFGNGLTDAAFCAWVGAMDKANTIQGFMHAMYSVGALFAPLVATNMIVSAGLPWYTYYYVMVSGGLPCWLLNGRRFGQLTSCCVDWRLGPGMGRPDHYLLA